MDEIVRIARGSGLGSAPVASGFLVSNYSAADYRSLLATATTFAVVALDDRLLGFVIVMARECLPLSDGSQLAPIRFQAPSLVIKQVAVDPECRRARIGTVLYREVMRRHSSEAIAATVVHQPRNQASIVFHMQLGFVHVAEMPNEGGGVSGLWLRLPDDEAVPHIMASQYDRAVELYNHEDNLTWTKLQSCVYVSGAIAAALGFSVSTGSANAGSDDVVRGAVAAIAAIATWGLAVAINAGTSYTAARKAGVIDLEKRLARYGGQMVVNQPQSPFLRASPTRLVLKVLPVLLACAWTGFAVYLLLQT